MNFLRRVQIKQSLMTLNFTRRYFTTPDDVHGIKKSGLANENAYFNKQEKELMKKMIEKLESSHYTPEGQDDEMLKEHDLRGLKEVERENDVHFSDEVKASLIRWKRGIN